MADEATKPVRFGILGCAQIARKLSRAIALAPGAHIAAVGSRSIEKARRFVTDNGLPDDARAYGSYEAVLDDPGVDAVYVPLPTSLHVHWAVAAAERKKHVLLEKPVALCTTDLDRILAACTAHGVQFMDCTMWMHHPRTAKMRELLSDPIRFGPVKTIWSNFSFNVGSDFLENNIRIKPELDALGALGDVGWYCIRAILWAVNYQLPKMVVALPGTVRNEAGVILSCGSSLLWDDGIVATFHCSFLANLTMELSVIGLRGTLYLNDFAGPAEENLASFSFASGSSNIDIMNAIDPRGEQHVVTTNLPQEVLMVKEFSSLVQNIRDSSSKPNEKWPAITRKTQMVLDAVKASIDAGEVPINIAV